MPTDTYAAPVTDSGLSVRLDALVSQTQSAEPSQSAVGLDLAATLTWLRSDISGMRADLDALRAETAAAQAWVVARAATPEPAPDTSSLEDVVEDRLAALEDALDGLAERFEALVRDSTTDTGERLAAVAEQVQASVAAADDDRRAAALQRERDALAASEQGAVIEGVATTVQGGLDELAASVATSLESFSAAMAEARQADRESERRYLETLLGTLTQTLQTGLDTSRTELQGGLDAVRTGLQASLDTTRTDLHAEVEAMRADVTALLAPVDERIDALSLLVRDGFGTMRAGLLAEVGGAITRLEHENGVVRATVEAGLTELRGDLADALDEVRDGVESTVGGAREAITATLREHQTTSLDLRDSVVSSSAQLRDEVALASTSVRDDVRTNASAVRDELDTTTGEVRASIAAATDHADRAQAAGDALKAAIAHLDETLATLAGDWQPQVDAVVAQGHAAASSVLEQVQVEVDEAIAEMTNALTVQVSAIRDVTNGLGGGTDRLVSAGEALLGYLAERDRELERERDRMLHDVLDEFAQGLSAKQRRAAAGRLGDALERRRDARDADRFRREDAERLTSVVDVPTPIAALNAPTPAAAPEPAPAAAVEPAPAAPPAPSEPKPPVVDAVPETPQPAAARPAGPTPAAPATPASTPDAPTGTATARLRSVAPAAGAAQEPAALPVKRATQRRSAAPATSTGPRTATKRAAKSPAKKAAARSSATAEKPAKATSRPRRSIPKSGS